MKNKFLELINAADSIAILAHDNEDADAVGSCNAMKHALFTLGKSAVCIFSDTLEHRLTFMDEGYSVFDGKVPEFDLCICLDCADPSRLGKRLSIFEKAKSTVLVDHHITNIGFADVNIIDAKAPATGEVLYVLFSEMGIKMNTDIARNLYAAISSDSGSFKYSNVRPQTLVIASELLKYDIDHAGIARRLYDTETVAMMRFKGYLMNNIKEYLGGKVTVVCAPGSLLKEYNINEKDTGDIVNIPRMVEECEIAISIREYSDKIKISFRSNGKYNVAEISAKMGGGGHDMSAGASVCGKSIDEVENMVLQICEEVING